MDELYNKLGPKKRTYSPQLAATYA